MPCRGSGSDAGATWVVERYDPDASGGAGRRYSYECPDCSAVFLECELEDGESFPEHEEV